jgi:DNA-binding NarL/FixJ family response regulator
MTENDCRLFVVGEELAKIAEDAPGAVVVGKTATWEGMPPEAEPEMVLVDLEAAGVGGKEGLKELHQVVGDIPLLVVAAQDDPGVLIDVVESGASGLIPKPAKPEDIADAINVVRIGGSYLDPERTREMVEAVTAPGPVPSEVHLTNRETEVLELLAEGRSARQIAAELDVSERTVNTHVANLYRKLAVSNRVEAVRESMRRGIISPP